MVVFNANAEYYYLKKNNSNGYSYWKLGLSKYMSVRETIEYLEKRGYQCHKNASRPAVLDAVNRYQRGLLPYEGLSVSELESFCEARRLPVKATTASRLVRTIIRTLEKADDSATFRLFDLPPEIRNWIYELYFLDLPEVNTDHAQPPLTLASKQVRSEALPLFYTCVKFVRILDRVKSPRDGAPGDVDSPMRIPTAHLSQVKNFTLAWEMVSYREVDMFKRRGEYLAVHLTQDDSKGKAVNITGRESQELEDKPLEDAFRATLHGIGYWEDDFKLQPSHIEILAAVGPRPQ